MQMTVAACLLAAALGQPLDEIADRKEDVIYGRKSGTALTMDVLTPKGNANGIGIIWAASGGWYSDKSIVMSKPSPVEPLVKRGFTVFCVVMGSQPRYTIPDLVEDLNRATRYIRYHAADYKVDPDRLGITGMSAGGHLSLMMGTAGGPGNPKSADPVDHVSSKVQAVGCFFPPTDFLNYGKPGENGAGKGILKDFKAPFDFRKYVAPMTGNAFSGTYERITDEEEILTIVRMISPVNHISPDDAPTMIVHGDADLLVPIQQAQIFLEKLEKEGVPAKLSTKKGAAHGWAGMDKDMSEIADWFETHLVKKEAK